MSLPSFLLFIPVPLKARHNGWSPELQRRFIVALARGASIDAAARQVGKSRVTAYRLRARPGAASFAAAWDAALDNGKRVRIAAALAPRSRAPSNESRSPRNAEEARAVLARVYAELGRQGMEGNEGGKADKGDGA